MASGEWFIIQSGEHEGKWHLAGWMMTAIKVLPTSPEGPQDGVWLRLGICPRCRVVVPAEDDVHRLAYGDQTWAHEDWHAKTDYPHPVGEKPHG